MHEYYEKNPLYIYWRASLDNIRYLEKIKNAYTGKDSFSQNIFNWFEEIIDGCKLAYSKGNIYFIEQEFRDDTFEIQASSCYDGDIVLFINEKCVSACLDFIDEIYILAKKNNNRVILIGKETNYDTEYMELRSIPLSQEHVTFNFPIKFYKNRKRKSRERYVPNLSMN